MSGLNSNGDHGLETSINLISFTTPVAKSVKNENLDSLNNTFQLSHDDPFLTHTSPSAATNLASSVDRESDKDRDGLLSFDMLKEAYDHKLECLAMMNAINLRLVESLKERDDERLELMERNSILSKENNQLNDEIIAIERSFAELHRRYEKMKTALESAKQKEEDMKLHYQELQEKLSALVSSVGGQLRRTN
jgi:PREDICTED: hypothetical protein